MSKKSDPTQGMVAAKRPASRPTPKPLSAAEVRRQVQPALDRKDAELTRPKPPQKVSDQQEWRTG
jgi:hypothetical protein